MIAKHIIRGNIALIFMAILFGLSKYVTWIVTLKMLIFGLVIYNLIFGYIAWISSYGTYDTETDTLEWSDEE